MTLGRNIRYLRKKKGWSQEELAQMLNYKNYTSIQKWESGVAEPRFKTVQELANIFNVGIEELTGTDLEYESILSPQAYKRLSSYAHDILFKAADDATEDEIMQTVDYLNYLKDKRKE